MAIVFVRQAANTTYATTNTLTLATTAVNNTLILVVCHQSTGAISVADNASGGSNTWTLAATSVTAGASSQNKIDIWYALSAKSVTTVTVSEGAASAIAANVSEWSGISTVGSTNQAWITPTAGSTPAACAVTAAVGDLVVGGIAYYASASGVVAASPYTNLTNTGISTTQEGQAWHVATVAGSEGPAFTITGGSFDAGFVTVSFSPPAPPVTVTTGSVGVLAALASAGSTVAVAAGSLVAGLVLAATGTTVAVSTASAGVNAAMTAAATTVYTTTGVLGAGIVLGAQTNTVAATTGSTTLTAMLTAVGSQTGTYTTTGSLNMVVGFASVASTAATSTGTLNVATTTDGTAYTVTTTTGSLNVSLALTGAGTNPATFVDITVTAVLGPPRWAASLPTTTRTATLTTQRWKATL